MQSNNYDSRTAVAQRSADLDVIQECVNRAHARMLEAENAFLDFENREHSPDRQMLRYHETQRVYQELCTVQALLASKPYVTEGGA